MEILGFIKRLDQKEISNILTLTLKLQWCPFPIITEARLSAACCNVSNITVVIDLLPRKEGCLCNEPVSKVDIGVADSWWHTTATC